MGTLPQLTWTHPIDKHMFCPADGVVTGTDCVHPIDLAGLRQRAQDCIDAFGEGHWAEDDDTWIDALRITSPARPQDAVVMGRFIFAVSPEAVLALIGALEQRPGPGPGTD